MRKLQRSVAKHNMKAQGITQISKPIEVRHPITNKVLSADSFFSQNWRKYVY